MNQAMNASSEQAINGKFPYYGFISGSRQVLKNQAELKMFEITGKKSVSVVDISPVIGMHAGNGAIAVSLLFTN
jgi:fatty acid-binding protein DegV